MSVRSCVAEFFLQPYLWLQLPSKGAAPKDLAPQIWLQIKVSVALLRGTMPSIRKGCWQQSFDLLDSQHLVYTLPVLPTASLPSLDHHPLDQFAMSGAGKSWTSLSKGRKQWEDRSKVSEAQQKAADTRPKAVEHSNAGAQQGTARLWLLRGASRGDPKGKHQEATWGLYCSAPALQCSREDKLQLHY